MQSRVGSHGTLEEGKEPVLKVTYQSRPLQFRLLQFLLLFLGIAIVFSFFSMYMIRYLGNQNVVTVAQSAILPCVPEPNTLESWVKPPSSTLHVMNDSELFWRASFTPRIKGYPFKRIPKIAFMFLARGPLPMAPLWEKFLNGSDGLYSIYIHSLPFYQPDFPASSVFYGRQIPSQVHCQKMNGFSLFCSSPEASHRTGRLHSNYLSGMKSNTKYHEYHILKSGNYKALNARRPLSLHHPYRFYTSVNSSAKLCWKEDDSRIPYYGRREKVLNGGMVAHRLEKEHGNSSSLQSSEKHQTTFEEQEGIEKTNVISREHSRNQAEYNSKISEMSDEKVEMLHPLPSAEENVLADAASGVQAIYTTHKSGNREFVPLNLKKSKFVNGFSTLHDNSAQMRQECRSLPLETACIEIVSGNPERLSRKRSSVAMEGPICSSSSPRAGENNRMPYRFKSVNENLKGDHRKSLEEVEKSSDTSMMDSTSRLEITPDDVVRVIGPNFFWEVRRTIDHQQRIFAAQIFELHRLVKVQRLIAGSPDMLLEGNVILSKPSVNSFTENKLQRKIFPEPPALSLKPEVASPKLNPCPDSAAEDVQRKSPPTDDNKKGDVNPNSILKPYSGAPTATSFAPEDTKFGPCFFNAPSGYQWLVPVRSPSEGLIYKPYTGPYPPSSGFIAPVYGGQGTVSLTRMDAAYVNTAYGFPASNQQGIVIYTGPDTLGHSCFQTYAHSPEMNTSNPDSAVLQFSTTHSIKQYIIPYQSSCNVSQGSGMMTDSGRNLPVSKGGDFHGSTGSNPGERVQGDALSLFPTAPTDQMSRYSDQNQNSQRKIQVIKVVPHNPRRAPESAARIFRSIQEERKQQD